MARHFSIKKFNREVQQLIEEGYTPPSQLSVAQTLYQGVVIPVELNRGGQVRTYREALVAAEKFKPGAKTWYTYERYLNELKEFKAELGKSFTYKGFLKEKRAQYKRSIDTAFGEGYFDISTIPSSELRDILNQAWDETKSDPDGSATFADHLQDVLYSYGYQT